MRADVPMKRREGSGERAKLIAFLLFVPAALAELLTGNVPPLRFFSPLWLFIFVLMYGCGCLLVRQARAHWELHWGVVFLAVAYGIVEEGLTTKAFFNPEWEGVGLLAGYGMYGGVQWVWALGVTFAHATLSILVPIAISDGLWPALREAPVLGRRGLIAAATGFISMTILGMLSIGKAEGNTTIPFHPRPLLLIAAIACVAMLVWLAYRSRRIEIRTQRVPLLRPPVFFALAFVVSPYFLIVPNELARHRIPASVALGAELAMIGAVLAFAFLQLCHRRLSVRHTTALVVGFLMPWIALTPVHEFGLLAPNRNGRGMLAVGLVVFVVLLWWRRSVIRREEGSVIGR